MSYNSNEIKKQYENQCCKQRKENLVKIREEITNLSQSNFARELGFTKNDLSLLEHGDKNLSLFHIHAYKTYFSDKHNIDVSVDYLMGYTDVLENRSNKKAKSLGLSGDSIKMLETWAECKEKNSNIDCFATPSLFAINVILEDCLQQWLDAKKECQDFYPATSVLDMIKEFFCVDEYKLTVFDRFAFLANNENDSGVIKCGDHIRFNSTDYSIENLFPINRYGEAQDTDTIQVESEYEDSAICYVPFLPVFKSYIEKEIIDKLNKIRERRLMNGAKKS